MTYPELAASYRANPREIPTDPKTSHSPTWFYVCERRGFIYISSGREHPNVSSISPDRRLNPKEMEEMLELYLLRKQGKPVSQLARKSVNSVYWYGIFKDQGL